MSSSCTPEVRFDDMNDEPKSQARFDRLQRGSVLDERHTN